MSRQRGTGRTTMSIQAPTRDAKRKRGEPHGLFASPATLVMIHRVPLTLVASDRPNKFRKYEKAEFFSKTPNAPGLINSASAANSIGKKAVVYIY